MKEMQRTFYGNGYLMLTSVIQATAFGFFMSSLQPIYDAHDLLAKLPFLLAEFLTIVVLTYGYVLGARDVWWCFDGVDVLLPFALSLWEIIAIIILQNKGNIIPLWFLSYFLFMVTGISAIMHGKSKLCSYRDIKGLYIGEAEYARRSKWFVVVVLISILGTLIAATFTYLFRNPVVVTILGSIQTAYFLLIFLSLLRKDRLLCKQNVMQQQMAERRNK